MSNIMAGVVYRTGPITAADYDEAIEDLQRAKLQDECRHICCSVCEDTGHTAEQCHHNVLRIARRGAADETVWRCYHCGFLATTFEAAEEHFGRTDLTAPTCLLKIQLAAIEKSIEDYPVATIAEIKSALERLLHARSQRRGDEAHG